MMTTFSNMLVRKMFVNDDKCSHHVQSKSVKSDDIDNH
jgi:hypothetical protein